jgi:hypothetical protein
MVNAADHEIANAVEKAEARLTADEAELEAVKPRTSPVRGLSLFDDVERLTTRAID